ncbi:protein cueball-like [Amphibalanus amphitrite]|uniref:protein cueball-like n=1 Tax=Amphibalanus amphitrite TaxID=1232801 RepID=UPI001C9074CC|nr:protein cueball-like [Amphibalanus amphitrite]
MFSTGTWHRLVLLVLFSLFKVGRFEDLVIAQGGRLSVISLCSSRELRLDTSDISDVSAMTYDSATGRLLLSGDGSDGSHRLWTLQMSDGARARPVNFAGAPPGRLEGMVVSADHSAVYAADATNGTIVHVPLEHVLRRTAAASVLHLLPDDRPRGLAVDETHGLLFWTNWRFGRQSVERSGLDGSQRSRVVDSDLYLPGGVAADPSSTSVYFSDSGADGRLHVERVSEDGSARHALYRGRHPQASGLQLAAGSLYWSDTAGVWRLPLTTDGAGVAGSAELVAPLPGRPSAVLVLREDEQCASYTSIVPTAVPATAVSGAPADSCEDYCVVGRCRWDELRGRSCRCPPGFAGDRCEQDQCHNYCLGGGTCHRDVGGRVLCSCPPGASGDRCQHQASAAAAAAAAGCDPALGMSSTALRLLVCGLLVLLALQAALLAVLGIRLRRAARAAARSAACPPPQSQPKKRFVAVGRQLRPRPSPPRRDIEDCCQMTLCETPCVVSTAACERQGLVDQKSSGCDNSQALADLF